MAKRTVEVDDVANLEDVMKLTRAHVKEAALYPQGPWDIRNVGFQVSEVEGERGKQKLINLRYEGFEPLDGVDDEELAELDGAYEGRTLWVKRYISLPAVLAQRDGSLDRFIKFVEQHGIEVDDDMELDAMCKALKGNHIGANLGARSWNDKNTGELKHDNTVGQFFALTDEE